ncbi:LysR family transcriptional regulator [Siculibacillus lacustris]|uniref:LysR family transcriptional regulator n=1 Tax=Siculibacillus lacustris TaxID=1549641 RepID=A0A4Q9VVI9_9HYPH|nr:LysR family transcriptional regulator [Siculibacillus lacustris]TBW40277.1 LysR family transcriptional regulator [Siculibacillus lacustris]
MAVDIKSLETFLMVAQLASFRGAAERLHTTQPAISQRIAQLEADLGVRLLVRENRTVTPTPKGRELLIYAEKLLALRAEMIASVADPSVHQGVLRLGVAETIVHTWLPALVERVARVFPRLALEIEVDISPNLRERLQTREIDLAFLMDTFAGEPFVSRPLCRHALAFVASPKLVGEGATMTLEELARHPIMTFSRRTKPYEAVYQAFSRPDLPRVRLHASASLATLVRMAEEGLGIAAIPPAIVRDHLASGRLVRIVTRIGFPDLQFRAAWLAGSDSRSVEAIADIAAEEAIAAQPMLDGDAGRVGADGGA